MDSGSVNTREVILANGDRLPLREVVRHHLRLRAQLPLEELEWDVVYHLREVCLGRTIAPEPEHLLIREGFLREDGTVDPGLRSVVLSSVRGEGRLLHLEPPYTDPLDRALGDFLTSRELLLAQLDPAEAKTLFEKPQLDKDFDALRGLLGPSSGMPEITKADAKSFVRRLNERLSQCSTITSAMGNRIPLALWQFARREVKVRWTRRNV